MQEDKRNMRRAELDGGGGGGGGFSVSPGVVMCLLFVLWATHQCFFFNLLMGSGWRASLGRLIQISSSWRHYFKELLKLQPGDINVAIPSPQKKVAVGFRRSKI